MLNSKKEKLLFIGSFKLPKNGHYGGVYFASTTLRDGLKKAGFQIVEMDTTLKDINVTKVSKRIASVTFRNFNFLSEIVSNPGAKTLLVFLSAGNSYVDKLPAILLAKLLRKKVIIFPVSGHLLKDHKKRFYKGIINKTLKAADFIICQSSFWKNYFQSCGAEADKLVVIENWVNDKTIDRSKQLSFSTFKKSSIFKIVFISRIEKDKGIENILWLAGRLKKTIEVSVDVYGSGSQEDHFVEEIKAGNLSDTVFYRGWLKRENMLETINKHHLALFLSKVEGYPNVLLDYIFSKIPILATETPMAVSVGKENMSYFSQNDLDDLYRKIISCYQDYEEALKKAGKAYRDKSLNNSLDKTVNKLLKII